MTKEQILEEALRRAWLDGYSHGVEDTEELHTAGDPMYETLNMPGRLGLLKFYNDVIVDGEEK